MSMLCGLDLHRQQITFDAVNTLSGEVWRGRVWQPDRDRLRHWLTHDVAGKANAQPVRMNRPGFVGGSGYWFPTPVGEGCWAA